MGFRFTAERAADDLTLTGWVRNNPEGNVEIVCEGSEDNLKEFIQRIEASFSGYIRDREIDWLDSTGEFKDFSVKFH